MKIKVLNTDGVPDSVGDIFTPETVIDLPEQVPVRTYFTFDDTDCNILGYAKLTRQSDGVYAEIDFPVKGIPAIGGISNSTDHISISQIAVQDKPNADSRIGEIVNE